MQSFKGELPLVLLVDPDVQLLGDMWQLERLQGRLLAGAQVITDGRFCLETWQTFNNMCYNSEVTDWESIVAFPLSGTSARHDYKPF